MNYVFEYMFISELVNNTNADDFCMDSVEVFDDFDFTRGAFEDKYPEEADKFDWDSLRITKEMNSNVTYWLFRFPEPTKEPEAKWGIIIKKESKPLVYYTLEKFNDEKFVLGSYNKGNHLNHGFLDAATTIEQFVKAACDI